MKFDVELIAKKDGESLEEDEDESGESESKYDDDDGDDEGRITLMSSLSSSSANASGFLTKAMEAPMKLPKKKTNKIYIVKT